MATYASLTDQQKADIAAYDKFMRGLAASLAKVAKESNATTWNQFATANVDSVVASLDTGEIIPNSTNYDSARGLTKAEFLTLQTILRGLNTTQASNLALIVKAIGVNA